MNKSEKLKELVISLQQEIAKNEKLNVDFVNTAINALMEIDEKYKYDMNLFPEFELPTNAEFNSKVNTAPGTLAESLLWKMGKWAIYKNFVENYNNYKCDAPLSSKTDVVFAAFAKHLKNKNNPIYDQHALRAMWAINPNLKDQEICKAALFKSKGKKEGKWQETLSGTHTIKCYELYVKELNGLSSRTGLSKSALDKLLMPLGQALKENTGNFSDFKKLCWG